MGGICTVIFFILLISYGVILHSVRTYGLKVNHKDFYSCESHITVVILFFVPYIFLYARPTSTLPVDKFMTVVLTFITPMLNPLIYTMRHAEMKNSLRKPWNRIMTLGGRVVHLSYKT